MNTTQKPQLTKMVLWLMAIASGLVVANNYYIQPLLGLISDDLNITESQASNIAMITQIGYAAGLLFIVPLGDMIHRKKLILIDFIFIILALLGMALAKTYTFVLIFSFAIGFTSVMPQVFVPMAAEFSSPEKKTASIGMVMSGLLIGILLSRVFSGWVGDLWGWREMYYIAATIMLLLALIILLKLPDVAPNFNGKYSGLMLSVFKLARTQPVLQLAAFRGAMGFAAFSAFWTTLVFHLENPPFNAGAAVAGSFGIVGAIGALAAALVGRLTKILSPYRIILYALLLMLASWIIFYFKGYTYAGLITGVILIDLGLQSMHIMNQSAYFSLKVTATNRLNTVYMVSYFIGGSIGTFLAGLAWNHYQWTGVVATGTLFILLALMAHLLLDKKVEEK